MLCGDGCPAFTRDDVVRFTEPKLGYSRDSPAFEKFVNVLVGFNAKERKAFLQFTTGCSSLPPGKFDITRLVNFGAKVCANLPRNGVGHLLLVSTLPDNPPNCTVVLLSKN